MYMYKITKYMYMSDVHVLVYACGRVFDKVKNVPRQYPDNVQIGLTCTKFEHADVIQCLVL